MCVWLYGCRCCGILWCIYLPSDACDYSIVYHLQFTRPQTNTEVDVCLCGSWEYGVVKCDVVFSVHIFVSFICVFCLFIVHSLIRERPNASLCPCPCRAYEYEMWMTHTRCNAIKSFRINYIIIPNRVLIDFVLRLDPITTIRRDGIQLPTILIVCAREQCFNLNFGLNTKQSLYTTHTPTEYWHLTTNISQINNKLNP